MTVRTTAADALTDLILEVFRANGRLLAAGDALTRPSGQSAARWQVLGAIEAEPQTVAGIARTMGLARQSVQRTADLLAAEGIIEFLENPAHRRAKLVRLTERGHALVRALSERQAVWSNDLADGIALDEADIRLAYDVVRKVRVQLERATAQSHPEHTVGPPEGADGTTATGGRRGSR